MNAFTPVIRDSEDFGAATTPAEALESLAHRSSAASGPVPSRRLGGALRDRFRPDRWPGDGIPVFRGLAFTGFADRIDRSVHAMRLASGGQSVRPDDLWMQLRIAAALRAESWIAADFVGFSVNDGIVHLSGEVDSMHAKLTLLRIAAGTHGTAAIVDSLWVSCE